MLLTQMGVKSLTSEVTQIISFEVDEEGDENPPKIIEEGKFGFGMFMTVVNGFNT